MKVNALFLLSTNLHTVYCTQFLERHVADVTFFSALSISNQILFTSIVLGWRQKSLVSGTETGKSEPG